MVFMKNKRRKGMKIKYAAAIVLAFVVGILGFFGDSARANEDLWLIDQYENRVDPGTVIEMKTSSLQLTMQTSGISYESPDYEVEWSIENPDQKNFASVSNGSSKLVGIVKAISPGEVVITVTVKDATQGDAVVNSTTCTVRVVFAIDTSGNDLIYKKVNPDDEDRSLVVYSDGTPAGNQSGTSTGNPIDLNLNFGKAYEAQWTSANAEVATVGNDAGGTEAAPSRGTKGQVNAIGAGRTVITATYTPTGDPSTTYTAYLDVYVVPRISETSGGTLEKKAAWTIDTGDSIYADGNFQDSGSIGSKITWVVKKDAGDGTQTVIADSLGRKSKLISLDYPNSSSNQIQVTGVAGTYSVYFYAYGSYSSEEDWDEDHPPYNPTVITLTIRATIENRTEILHISDKYDYAEAYNMTVEDFLQCFLVEPGTAQGVYINYSNTTASLAALKETSQEGIRTIVKVRDETRLCTLLGIDRSGIEGYFWPSDGDGEVQKGDDNRYYFTTDIVITERFYMDTNSCVIGVNQEFQLNALFDGTIDGEIIWETSNKDYVTVDGTGSSAVIKGIKITPQNQEVEITATLIMGNGVQRTATCMVKVEAEVRDFTLSPNEDQTMLEGDHLTVVANIQQLVTVAPLVWMSTDEKVFTVEAAADGKSAIITAVGGGEATLMVYNENNKSRQTLKISVRVPIDEIIFDETDISVGLYKAGYNLRNNVRYMPENATDRELQWACSDTSVLTVDEDGYLTFNTAGTVLVTVTPKFNPYSVMAQCLVTIIGTPDEITIEETDILMNVGEDKMVNLEYSPENTVTELKWTPSVEGIADVSYNDAKKIATFKALAPGVTNFNVVSTEGLINNVKVTVRQPSEDIAISPSELTIKTGQSEDLSVEFTPANSTDTLVWTSMDTSIVRVNENGRVTGIKSGQAIVQVQAYNGTVKGPIAGITVIVRDGVQSVELDEDSKTVEVDSSITITPQFTPETAYDKAMTWTISDTGIATVQTDENGINAIVTGVKVGVTMLTGSSADGGYRVSCLIRVVPKPVDNNTNVTVSPTMKYLKLGKTFYVTAKVTGTPNKKVKWTTSKKKVATVTSGGKVKGKKIGTAYIRATARDGSGAYAQCKVRVVRQVTKLRLNRSKANLLVGDTLTLKTRITPKNATVKKVKWTTSDKSIATVESNGRVLGVGEGIVKIRATTTDGSNKKATCIIKVREPVEATGVTVANSEITVAKGRSVQSGIVASPTNTTTKIRYYSDHKKIARVDSKGKIWSKRAGQATIYGETANGLSGYCDVLVVDLNRKGLVMRQYDTEQLTVNEIGTNVKWYSKNINIATVSPTGLITGRRKGTTTVYAVVKGIKLGCRVKIKKIK